MNVSVRIYLKATRQYLIRIQFKITDEGLVLEVQLIKLIVTIDRVSHILGRLGKVYKPY